MDEEDNGGEIQTTITKGHSGHSQILHVRQDSANELDQLFNVVLDPSKKTKSLPMKHRKLPKSFFQQPDRPRHAPMHAHSRSMGGLVSTPINHSRSSSTDSSASHQSGLNLSSSNLHQQSPAHVNNNPGARTGNFTPGPVQHYPFANTPHMGLQLPQIAHSRSKSSPASLQIANANLQMKIQQPSNQIEVPPDMPLPQGWEFAKTPDGQTYFMNHTDRTTTWVDPRIAILEEQQGRANANNMQAVNHQQPQMHINNVQQAEQVQQPLPAGWEQATTPQGEIYFINHETRTTSWLDPRQRNVNVGSQSQMNAQIQQQLHKMNQLDIGGPVPSSYQQRGVSGSQMMIKQLAKDKEILMMKMRQPTIFKQTGMDPFLGSNPSYHEREPSRDSGVSGMGSNFNIPRASDDYMESVEEMDTDGGNHNPQMGRQQQSCMATAQRARQQQQHAPRGGNAHQQQQAQHFPDFLDSLPASSVDFSNDGNHQQSNALDGDELVPSISDTLSPDFINDVESMLNPVVKSENMDSMTWL